MEEKILQFDIRDNQRVVSTEKTNYMGIIARMNHDYNYTLKTISLIPEDLTNLVRSGAVHA